MILERIKRIKPIWEIPSGRKRTLALFGSDDRSICQSTAREAFAVRSPVEDIGGISCRFLFGYWVYVALFRHCCHAAVGQAEKCYWIRWRQCCLRSFDLWKKGRQGFSRCGTICHPTMCQKTIIFRVRLPHKRKAHNFGAVIGGRIYGTKT